MGLYTNAPVTASGNLMVSQSCSSWWLLDCHHRAYYSSCHQCEGSKKSGGCSPFPLHGLN